MYRSNPQQCSSTDVRLVGFGDSIERDESLSQPDLLAEHKPPCGSPWDITMPADLDVQRPSQPFREPMRGLVLREVIEPDIFRHFFGASAVQR